MITLGADHAVARVDRDEALKHKVFNRDDIEKMVRKMMAIETHMEMTRLDVLDELRKVLTDG